MNKKIIISFVVVVIIVALLFVFVGSNKNTDTNINTSVESPTKTSVLTDPLSIRTPVNNPPPKATTVTTPSNTTANTKTSNSYTISEIAKHGTKENCWIAIGGNVYDVSGFIASGQHNDKILQGCGKDATSMFDAVEKHQEQQQKVQSLMKQFLIGTVKL